MNKVPTIFVFCVMVASGCVSQALASNDPSNVRFVNPMIGTAPSTTQSALAHGQGTENSAQVIPEVTVPFGMTNWTPQTRHVETKCVAPYYFNDSLITGFRGSHWLSGSCTQDYGSFTIMPIAGSLRIRPEVRGSRFSHSSEVSTPYNYRVQLDDYRVEGEMTATRRCGYCRFTFETADSAFVVVEPNSDAGEGYLHISPEHNEIVGYNPVHRIYQGWGERAGFSGYFVAQFRDPFASYGVYDGLNIQQGKKEISNRKGLCGFVRFASAAGKGVVVRIGTSFTSIEEARKNLVKETAGMGFDEAKERLRAQWDALLSRV